MVLESAIDWFEAENHPRKMFWYGLIYMTVAMVLAYWIFAGQASLVMVFLATIATVPLMYKTIQQEEAKDLQGRSEKYLLKEHAKALQYFMYMFFGVTVACAAAYTVVPAEVLSSLFNAQTKTISQINTVTTGQAFNLTGAFGQIFFNNVRVLVFCVLFSFLYGAGAIYILNWNATVVGTAIGTFIRGSISSYSHLVGWEKAAVYFQVITEGLLKYTIHGIPEILSYFTAGLAGGIISVAVIKHDYNTRKFEHVLLDSADLLLISIALVFIAAILEVAVTPIVF
jgi:uncharacterized membrane protein SpoIIM required for sporulation